MKPPKVRYEESRLTSNNRNKTSQALHQSHMFPSLLQIQIQIRSKRIPLGLPISTTALDLRHKQGGRGEEREKGYGQLRNNGGGPGQRRNKGEKAKEQMRSWVITRCFWGCGCRWGWRRKSQLGGVGHKCCVRTWKMDSNLHLPLFNVNFIRNKSTWPSPPPFFCPSVCYYFLSMNKHQLNSARMQKPRAESHLSKGSIHPPVFWKKKLNMKYFSKKKIDVY